MARNCPICGSPASQAHPFLEEHIDPARLSAASFSSRKIPEYMCHHMVVCSTCDLAFADQPPEEGALAKAYHLASYDSSEEADDAARAYIRAVRPVINGLRRHERALEIGTGTGVFLEHLKQEGFAEVVGVEPSTAAIDSAPPQRRSWIREGMFDAGDFAPGSFDLICCFMTLEHVRDPGSLARSTMELLRPGGAFVIVAHDRRSLINRVLGSRSPIIDIEHLQLFSRRSILQLFVRSGYTAVSAASFSNQYSLRYWSRLAPLPTGIKEILTRIWAIPVLRDLRLRFNVGNTLAVGYRPADDDKAPSANRR